MADKSKKILEQLSPQRIVLPVALGIAVIAFIFYSGFNREALKQINWTGHVLAWFILSLLMMCVRHIAYMYRIKLLTENRLSWKKSFQVISLWEFSSAITPSTVGGATVALFLLSKEKISLGKSTTIVVAVTLLDNLFFVIGAPLFFLLLGKSVMIPTDSGCLSDLNIPLINSIDGLGNLFIAAYGLFLFFTGIFGYGIFVNPKGFGFLINKIFTYGVLKRWRQQAAQVADDVLVTSKELSGQKPVFWLKALIATFISWSARYLVLNFILMAFATPGIHIAGFNVQSVIFGRQFIMWVIMLLPATPGSTGIAELAFLAVQCKFFLAGLEGAILTLWRIIGYYIYLMLGVFILPRWIRRVIRKPKV